MDDVAFVALLVFVWTILGLACMLCYGSWAQHNLKPEHQGSLIAGLILAMLLGPLCLPLWLWLSLMAKPEHYLTYEERLARWRHERE